MSLEVKQHNKTILGTLEVGDLVEFPRGIYSHWGLYIGDGKIIHLTGVDRSGTAVDSSLSHVFTISGIKYKTASVIVEDFWKVAGHNKVKKNNEKDKIKGYNPSSPKEIVERALEKIGEASYKLLWYNCEHFAVWCRYGILKSQQVDTVLEGGVIVGALITGLGIIGAVLSFIMSRSSKNR